MVAECKQKTPVGGTNEGGADKLPGMETKTAERRLQWLLEGLKKSCIFAPEMETRKTPAEIVTELHKLRFVDGYAAHFMGVADKVYKEDIVQELYLMVCEVAETKIAEAYEAGGIESVKNYVAGLVIRQMRSVNSIVYKKYTRHVYRFKPADNIMDLAEHGSRWEGMQVRKAARPQQEPETK